MRRWALGGVGVGEGRALGACLTKTEQDPRGDHKQNFYLGTKKKILDVDRCAKVVRKVEVACYKDISSPPDESGNPTPFQLTPKCGVFSLSGTG